MMGSDSILSMDWGSVTLYVEGRPNSCCNLNGLSWIPCTIKFILYKEEVIQFPSMAFFGGIYLKGE
jgi:hypothetical protein